MSDEARRIWVAALYGEQLGFAKACHDSQAEGRALGLLYRRVLDVNPPPGYGGGK